MRADEGGVAGPEEAEGGHARMRVAGFTAGAVVALTLLGLAASVGGGAGVGARLGAGWLQEDSKDLKHPKLVLPAYGATQQRSVVNKEGGIPVGAKKKNYYFGTAPQLAPGHVPFHGERGRPPWKRCFQPNRSGL